MKTKSKSRHVFAKIPKDYTGLVLFFLPRAIHDEVDYANTVDVIDRLAGHDLTDDQELYLDTLSTLVEAYEEAPARHGPSQPAPLQSLRALMEEHGMSAADLGMLLGERTLGSKLLRGQRKIGLTYARILSRKFAVDMGLFLE